MEDLPEDPKALPDDLESLLLETDQAQEAEAKAEPRRLADLLHGAKRYLLGLTFVGGLLLGWIGIGWWLWPVQWTNSNPWQLAPQYQRTFVSLVAEEYWRTSDVSRAKQSLAGWGPTELKALLTAMNNETTDAETRQQLTALAAALEIPGSETSLVSSIFGQTGVIVSIILSASLLLGAGVILAAPRFRQEAPFPEEQLAEGEASEESLEELLANVELDGQQVQEGQAAGVQEQGQQEEEKEEEKEEEAEEDQPAEEQGGLLGDLLSLFEEEDTSLSVLEIFCKGMPDVVMADLIETATTVARHLKRANQLDRKL
jgi:hypothetical protein